MLWVRDWAAPYAWFYRPQINSRFSDGNYRQCNHVQACKWRLTTQKSVLAFHGNKYCQFTVHEYPNTTMVVSAYYGRNRKWGWLELLLCQLPSMPSPKSCPYFKRYLLIFMSRWCWMVHPISAFDAGCQPEILSPIARLPAGLYYSILFVQKMRAFRRLVLECIQLCYAQCIQLAMRQANKREKNPIMAKRKIIIRLRSLWDWTHHP
jgi:hypothetical protein